MGCGEVVGGMVDVYGSVVSPVRVKFEPEKINALLGTDIPKEKMLDIFEKLELHYDEETNEIIAPTFRQDIHLTADLAEEVARFFGYDHIPTTLPSGQITTGKQTFEMMIDRLACRAVKAKGFSQGYSYSFESPKVFDKLRLPEDSDLRKAIKISNPLGEDFSVMRTQSVNGMLVSLANNFKHRIKALRLFELGHIYIADELPLTDLPNERQELTLGMYGDGDFYEMKGCFETVLETLGLTARPEYVTDDLKPFLHPGRQADVLYENETVGYLGEVHPLVAREYNISERVYVAVLDMPVIYGMATFDRHYNGIARYPSVSRDISMVVPREILAGDIEKIILQRGGKLLESYELFDIYEGDQIEEGYKSIAYSLTFRAKDKTLSDDEVGAAMKKILNGLEGLGISLRS